MSVNHINSNIAKKILILIISVLTSIATCHASSRITSCLLERGMLEQFNRAKYSTILREKAVASSKNNFKLLDLSSQIKNLSSDRGIVRRCKLIFPRPNDLTRDYVLNHDSTKRGNILLASFKKSSSISPPFYDIRYALAPNLEQANQIFPVYNQGKLGSCTANTAAGAMQYHLLLKNPTLYAGTKGILSRLFIYYNIRSIQPWADTAHDTGGTIAATVAAIINYGACMENLWPYSDNPKQFRKAPLPPCYQAAYKYMSLDNPATANIPQDHNTLETFKTILSQNHPILIGVKLYSSFGEWRSYKKGLISTPDPTSEKLLGGHALMITGYNDEEQTFTVRNSWGTEFGDKGYCYIPYEYIANPQLAQDFWFITKIGAQRRSYNLF